MIMIADIKAAVAAEIRIDQALLNAKYGVFVTGPYSQGGRKATGAKYLAIYLAREMTRKRFSIIGREFGVHRTVALKAHAKVEAAVANGSETFVAAIAGVRRRLTPQPMAKLAA